MTKCKWIYKGKPLENIPDGAYGFVYKISFPTDNSYYVGEKAFYSITNKRISKKRSEELYTGTGRKRKKERIERESNWHDYNSSSKEVQKRCLEETNVKFEILKIFTNKAEMDIYEFNEIVKNLCDPLSLNGWAKTTIYKNGLCNK